jgi:hypothetical protein
MFQRWPRRFQALRIRIGLPLWHRQERHVLLRRRYRRKSLVYLKEPDVQRRLKELSLVPVGSSSEETGELLKRESEIWRQVIAASGLKAE